MCISQKDKGFFSTAYSTDEPFGIVTIISPFQRVCKLKATTVKIKK